MFLTLFKSIHPKEMFPKHCADNVLYYLWAMQQEFDNHIANALLTSVFSGIIATLISMAYYLGFKEITDFPYSAIVNVSSLIFGINIIFVLIGFIYSFFLKFSRKGEIQFIVLFVLITAGLLLLALHTHRSENALLNHEFQELISGLVIIAGISAFALIPFLYHNRKFINNVLHS